MAGRQKDVGQRLRWYIHNCYYTTDFQALCEMHTLFWLENLKGRERTEDLGVDGKTTSECILEQ